MFFKTLKQNEANIFMANKYIVAFYNFIMDYTNNRQQKKGGKKNRIIIM